METETKDFWREEISRRKLLDYMALGGLFAFTGGLLTSCKPSLKDEVVRLGYLPITDATALLVAYAQGYFEEEGLKVEPPILMRNWSSLVEAFTAGKVNVVHLLKPIALWLRYNNGFPVKVMAWANTNGSAIVVGKDSGIRDFRDLGGKQLAVPYWYSIHNIVLQYTLRTVGLKAVIRGENEPLAKDEVNLQILPPPDMPSALSAGKIHGYIVAEPFNALGELKAGARMLRFTGDVWRNHPCCVVCMNEKEVNANVERTQKIINAIVRAQIYASKNKEKTAVLLSKDGKGFLPMPAEVVIKAMTDYDSHKYPTAIRNKKEFKNGRIDFQPWPYPSATKFVVEAMKQTLVAGDTTFLAKLDPEVVAQDLVDYRFVKAACEKYPEWKEDPSVNPTDPYNRQEVFKL